MLIIHSLISVFVTISLLLLGLEVVIYPGVVDARLGLPLFIFPVLSIVLILIARFSKVMVLKMWVQQFLVIAAAVSAFSYLLLHLSNRLIHPNFSFGTFHIHPSALPVLIIFLTLLFVTTLHKQYAAKGKNLILFLLPFWAIGMMYMFSVYSESGFWYVAKEDSVTEWLNFVVYVLCCIFSVKISQKVKKYTEIPSQLRTVISLLFMLGAVAFFVIAGEEISWAQRVIGFDTPEELVDKNTQKELNLHNNVNIFPYVYYTYAAIALYSALTWIVRRVLDRVIGNNKTPIKIINLFIPPGYLIGYFVPMVIYVYVRKTYGDVVLDRWEEFAELLLGLGLLLFLMRNNSVLKSKNTEEQ